MKKIKRYIKILTGFYSDFIKYKRYSLINAHNDVDQEHILGLIIRVYHTIEKGLSNKNIKYEFGLDNIELLINTLLSYKGCKNDKHVLSALKTLELYFFIHNERKNNSVRLLTQKQKFEHLAKLFNFSNIQGGRKKINIIDELPSYSEMIKKRSSIRIFDNRKIDLDTVTNIIDTAKYCPSACNRHAVKVFYSLSTIVNNQILELQNGSKTFRNNVPGLLIVASDLRYQEGIEERNLGYIEGGIWTLSLTNSIYFYGLGGCVLNWCVAPMQDSKLKKLLGIPDYYQISSLIAFGYPDKEQCVPFSIRKDTSDFMTEINISHE